jgi:hypothetical protein
MLQTTILQYYSITIYNNIVADYTVCGKNEVSSGKFVTGAKNDDRRNPAGNWFVMWNYI